MSSVKTVTFLGDIWRYSTPPAHEWMTALTHDPDGLTRIFPGFLVDEQFDDMLAIVDEASWDPEALDDLHRRWRNVARVIVGRHTGREWWRAVNLMKMCLGAWTGINGSLLLSGCDAKVMDLESWLDAAYVHLMRTCDDEGRQKIEFELNKIPRGVKVPHNSMSIKNSLAKFAAD